MSGNFTDYARGICYPAHTNTCPPPKDPGQQPFFIRQGPCTIGTGGSGTLNVQDDATHAAWSRSGMITAVRVAEPVDGLDRGHDAVGVAVRDRELGTGAGPGQTPRRQPAARLRRADAFQRPLHGQPHRQPHGYPAQQPTDRR